MVDCFALDEISNELEEKRVEREKSAFIEAAKDPDTSKDTWDADKLFMIGIITAIVILSCAVLVYAARH